MSTMENESKRKRSVEDGECEGEEAKRIRSDILGILEDDADADEGSESGTTSGELLTSVMRSLQDEIEGDDALSRREDVSVLPDLGYLLEASDDELGLPPAGSDDALNFEGILGAVSEVTEVPGFVGCWDFEEGIPGFAVEEYGFAGVEIRYGAQEELDAALVFQNPFDYDDFSLPSDYSSMGLWRSESMPFL